MPKFQVGKVMTYRAIKFFPLSLDDDCHLVKWNTQLENTENTLVRDNVPEYTEIFNTKINLLNFNSKEIN